MSRRTRRPSWRFIALWVVLMSGAFSLVREFSAGFLAMAGRPAPASATWALLTQLALAAFVISGVSLVFAQQKDIRRLEAAQTPSPRAYVRETSGREIVDRFNGTPWNERKGLVDSYTGRWLRGRAKVAAITPAFLFILIQIGDADSGRLSSFWGTLIFPRAAHDQLANLREGDTVEYEGQISGIDELTVKLKEPSLTIAASVTES
jgi:hypothetical protein